MSKQRFELYWEDGEDGEIWGQVMVDDNLIIVSTPTHKELLAEARYAIYRFNGIPQENISFFIKHVSLKKEEQ